MLNLTAYLDDSGIDDKTGTEPGSQVAVIAGFVATAESWRTLVGDWVLVLRESKVSAFHMSECEHGLGEFRGWTLGRKTALVDALVSVILSHEVLFGLAGFVYVRDYDDWLTPGWPASEQIGFVFDRHEQFGRQGKRCYRAFKQFRDREATLGTIAFRSRKRFVALQTADLLAYILRRHLCEEMRRPGKELRPALLRITTKVRFVSRLLDRNGLAATVQGIGEEYRLASS
jgi:uncharacterized protein DUF3800